jgi:alanine racemase
MSTEQGRQDALALVKQPGLQLVGIMTHFAVEDAADVRKGLATFKEQSQWLIDTAGLDRSKLTLHAANSFATLEVPESHLDMVRPGGLIYGDTLPSYTEYRRVMAFKTRVAAVSAYPAGNTVGYDRTYTLKRDSLLANLPMGYSDGYRRVFTNKGFVLINGQRAPVVGKVSMNTTMVDVTDIPVVKPGDEVVLFGKQGNADITQAEMEDINGALLADLYTVWGNSNPRRLK